MHPGHAATVWTIRLALGAYAAALGLGLLGTMGQRLARTQSGWQRPLWTVGCGLLWAHLAAAFHYYHDWSHHRAWLDTARQTRELLGWEFGDGIYFSYVFALLWTADAAWWWLAPNHYQRRPRWQRWTIHLYLLFIAFNGTVVFEAGAVRWWGVAVSCVLVGLAIHVATKVARWSPAADAGSNPTRTNGT